MVINTKTTLKRSIRIRKNRLYSRSDNISAYVMLIPFLVLFCAFTVYPLLWGIRFMFCEYDGMSQAKFIGLDHFKRIFTRDYLWWKSVLTTFKFAGLKLAIEIPIALILAAVLNSKIRGRNFFRTVYFLPTVTSLAIMAMVFTMLFSSYNGIINVWLKNIGLIDEYIDFIGTPGFAMLTVVIVAVWSVFGQNVMFFLSAMQNISEDIYEAAKLDGAGVVQTFFKITLPLIAPTFQIIFMLAIIGSLTNYGAIMVMTNGGPNGATMVMGLKIYNQFFGESRVPEYGYGAALSFVSAIIVGLFTVVYLKMTKHMEEI